MSISNSGVIRNLKKINENINLKSKYDSANQRKEHSSLYISILALVISAISIYLQFFYQSYQLKASIVDSNIDKKSVSLSLLYSNKGNQDATIISSEIFFNSDRNEDKKKYHIQFVNYEEASVFILAPGKQIFHELNQIVYFAEPKLLDRNKTNTRDTLRVNLRISYITERTMQTDTVIKCGWITLDSLNMIKHYSIDYNTFELNSKSSFSRGYNYQISNPKKGRNIKDSIIDVLKY